MSDILDGLAQALNERRESTPDSSYAGNLFRNGLDSILKKIIEKAIETALAVKDGKHEKIVHETAELWFHTMVMLVSQDLGPRDVIDEMERLFSASRLDEKEPSRSPTES